ncbi:hypothetical protein SISSUDRAFT_1050256 [Sistotremastrum suecicum HHB10207 ss-3]|uniref:Uncharacterized protein n=1 Tax=Sistotremastrum suecicum HHB10207 ss-3 TaxID=1314776 RepID=A0A166B9Z3_9AGAM|nr:hypothetical protein SISSUDRAFT_1050256 [Sistotremastrum suecicum HHB10207 ss-3]
MRLTAGSNPSHAPNLSPPIVAQFARLPEDILHQHAGYNGGTSDTSLSLAFQGPNYPRGSLPNVAYISSTEHKTAAAHTATSQPKLRDQHPNKKRRIFDEEKNIEKPRRNPKQVQAEVNCKDRKTFAFNLLGTRLEEILEGECAVPEFMADRLNLATETLGDLEQQVKLRDRIIELYMQLDSILTEKARLLEAITQARAEKEWILIGNLMASD